MLIILLAFVTAVSAQHTIKNPDLPKCLVFQWQIKTDQVAAGWSNKDFFITRDQEGMVVYYGVYYDIAQALSAIPDLPRGIKRSNIQLVAFFNQQSIDPDDALILLSDQTAFDVGLRSIEEKQAISFTVYFATYDQPQGMKLINQFDAPLSFEVLPNYNYAYSAGSFSQLEQAQAFAEEMRSAGYTEARVNKYLNGERLAYEDEALLEQFIAFASESSFPRFISF